MKNQIVAKLTKAVRNTVLHFGIASLFVFAVIPSNAQGKTGPNGLPVEIKYLGMLGNLPVFQVEFQNAENEVYTLSIKDEDGNTLYTEKVKGKKFLRTFKWDRNDASADGKLTFTFAGQNESRSQVFEINRNIRVVEDVVVTKL